jgi:hypothetical protein
MANSYSKKGAIFASAGFIIAIAPIAISNVARVLGIDIGNGLQALPLVTAPVVVALVVGGFVSAIVGASKSTASDFAESAMSTQGQAKAGGTGSPSDAKPVELPPLPSGLARTVKIVYAFGFVVVLVGPVMRTTIFPPVSEITSPFDAVPVIFAGWFVFLARNAHEGLGFLRLYQSQLVVSIAGCVAGVFFLFVTTGFDVFQIVGTEIIGLIPFGASVASIVFAGVARWQYRKSIAKY